MLEATEKQQENGDLVTRAKWLRKVAGQRSKLGNKLITTTRRIKATGYHRQAGQDEGKTQNAHRNHHTCLRQRFSRTSEQTQA